MKAISKIKDISEKFDTLLSLTMSIKMYDCWICDNEMWGSKGDGNQLDECITLLSKAWKELMAKSNEELNVDPEYTRPSVKYLLDKFTKIVSSCESVNVSFKYT